MTDTLLDAASYGSRWPGAGCSSRQPRRRVEGPGAEGNVLPIPVSATFSVALYIVCWCNERDNKKIFMSSPARAEGYDTPALQREDTTMAAAEKAEAWARGIRRLRTFYAKVLAFGSGPARATWSCIAILDVTSEAVPAEPLAPGRAAAAAFRNIAGFHCLHECRFPNPGKMLTYGSNKLQVESPNLNF